jgi:hypothetical protein
MVEQLRAEVWQVSRNKKFEIRLTLAELYAIRNALYEMGNNDELLAKINEQIDMLHAYFDGRWILPKGIKPDLRMWRKT